MTNNILFYMMKCNYCNDSYNKRSFCFSKNPQNLIQINSILVFNWDLCVLMSILITSVDFHDLHNAFDGRKFSHQIIHCSVPNRNPKKNEKMREDRHWKLITVALETSMIHIELNSTS